MKLHINKKSFLHVSSWAICWRFIETAAGSFYFFDTGDFRIADILAHVSPCS